jgi:hypothetical protein
MGVTGDSGRCIDRVTMVGKVLSSVSSPSPYFTVVMNILSRLGP